MFLPSPEKKSADAHGVSLLVSKFLIGTLHHRSPDRSMFCRDFICRFYFFEAEKSIDRIKFEAARKF